MKVRGLILLSLLLAGWSAVGTAVEVLATDALLNMENEDPARWPLMDARPLFERSQRPIPGALAPDAAAEALTPGKLLVIGDDLQAAKKAARAAEARLPAVHAVVLEEGLSALVRLRPELANHGSEANASWMPGTFTIPKNTCEADAPIHTFRSESQKKLDELLTPAAEAPAPAASFSPVTPEEAEP